MRLPEPSFAHLRLTDAKGIFEHAEGTTPRPDGDSAVTAHGLALLDCLLATQTVNGRLSVTPAGGWGPGELRARFDQQPIEAAALADACARAFTGTGE